MALVYDPCRQLLLPTFNPLNFVCTGKVNYPQRFPITIANNVTNHLPHVQAPAFDVLHQNFVWMQQISCDRYASLNGAKSLIDYEIQPISEYLALNFWTIYTKTTYISSAVVREKIKDLAYFAAHVLSATRVSSTVIICALLYFERLFSPVARNTMLNAKLSTVPQHEQLKILLTLGLALANKYLEDNNFLIKIWAEVSGINATVLVTHELNWLEAVNWDLSLRDTMDAQCRRGAIACGFWRWHYDWNQTLFQPSQLSVTSFPYITSIHLDSAPALVPPLMYQQEASEVSRQGFHAVSCPQNGFVMGQQFRQKVQ